MNFGDSSALGTRRYDSDPPPMPPVLGYDVSPYLRALRLLSRTSGDAHKEVLAMVNYLEADPSRKLSPRQIKRLSEIEAV